MYYRGTSMLWMTFPYGDLCAIIEPSEFKTESLGSLALYVWPRAAPESTVDKIWYRWLDGVKFPLVLSCTIIIMLLSSGLD